MQELTKSIHSRLKDIRYTNRYFVGKGIDIGGAPDPLFAWKEIFPFMESCKTWDLDDGDGQYLDDVDDNFYDFVHSSHCLEHMNDPKVALKNWWRVFKPGGHMICTVPDEDLYEQGIWPSMNPGHKWSLTVSKEQSWSPKSLNILDLVKNLGTDVEIKKIEVQDASYRYDLKDYYLKHKGKPLDQTQSGAESCIEFILQKKKHN